MDTHDRRIRTLSAEIEAGFSGFGFLIFTHRSTGLDGKAASPLWRAGTGQCSVLVPSCANRAPRGCLHCLNTSIDLRFSYPFEEFMDHVRAMKTVRDWEYTLRFGHVGAAQNSRANSARVVEY